nr:MAG TPA: hypothetical protein [Caudoviricetes sp.]
MVGRRWGILIGTTIVRTIVVPMSGHLFVWCGSRADNLTRG